MLLILIVFIIGLTIITTMWALIWFDIHERVHPSFHKWDRLFLAHHPGYKGPKVAGK